MQVTSDDALIVVDVQNTFCPGGTLAVPDGDTVVGPINRILPLFGSRVWATQDWHPSDHCSFAPQGGPWPPHAVRETEDAALHRSLHTDMITHIVQKGTDPAKEAYSGFDGTDLAQQLRDAGIRRVFVAGLATDYCVRATALDARDAGLDVVVLTDAIRAVDVQPQDGPRALEEMQDRGCRLATTGDVLKVNRAGL